jgi:signal transduction histidine kinase
MMRRKGIYLVVVVIGILLLGNSFLTEYNNDIIQQNKQRQEETAVVEAYYDQIGKVVIHALDIGLRGYAIFQEEKFSAPMDNALVWKDSILVHVEYPLIEMKYDMREFYVFRDSLDAYALYCYRLKHLLQQGQDAEFRKIFYSDKGGHLYWQYIMCEKSIHDFLERIDREAEENYEAALFRNYALQLVLFLTCFPTLLYTAFYARKTFKLSEQLRHLEQDKNEILTRQNHDLERMVAKRTQEIAAQNEELSSQHDALAIQNRHFQEAQKIIEKQNLEIHSKNRVLESEVNHRTLELQDANRELVEQNNQLEQFAFIVAHNLRAPVARMLGLANLMQLAGTQTDKEFAIEKLMASTRDMDQVIKDLTHILDIKRFTGGRVEVDLPATLTRVLNILETEIQETQATIKSDFSAAAKLMTSVPYLESILYNLIHNAIKYRAMTRVPVIRIRTRQEENYVVLSVSDNGLGIDLAQYGHAIFSLYKRFHLHVEGKGLGLYLVKSQVQALGGKVEVDSELDTGTTFHIYFKR